MAANESQKITLVDGSGYIFRAFYAVRPLSNRKGVPTHAVYGFVSMLLKYLEAEKPKHLAIAFDTGRATFRKERYPEYKANREAAPDDLRVQIPYIQRFVDAMRIRRLELQGFEADDLIGTLSRRAAKDGFTVDIVTGDKDMMQLVDEKVHLVDTMKDRRIDRKAVVERFGVEPEQIADFLGLMGDSSDNIPGVTGIGEKTASELIGKFGSLEKLYDRIAEISQPKRRETLLKEKEEAFLSRELATIVENVPVPLQWDDFLWNGPDKGAIETLFAELDFQSLLRRFEGAGTVAPVASAETSPAVATATAPGRGPSKVDRSRYRTVASGPALRELVESLRKAKLFAFDTETTALQPHEADLVGISFAWEAGEAAYVPVGHRDLAAVQLPASDVREALRGVLEDPTVRKVGQNAKYDMQVLRRWGVEVRGLVGDTLLESYLVDPAASHSLDSLAARHLDHTTISYEELTGKGKKQINFADVPVERAAEYAAEDADVTLRVHEILAPRVRESGMENLYANLEVPLVPILAEMEWRGILVDKEALEAFAKKMQVSMAETTKKIHGYAGAEFNIGSPKQLSEILFTKLGLRVVRRTKTGISTDESVLVELADEHPICQEILRYRELAKLQSTYVDGLLSQISPETGRVHTSFNQTVAATGRLSSSNPNLQNIPITGEGGAAIRAAFRAKEGCSLLSADYSQVELRVLAHLSGDKALSRAFLENEDVHASTAREIFGVKDVTSDQRRIAKTINFGVVYGQTAYGLSQTLRIPPGEAKKFIETYFAKYNEVYRFHETLIENGREKGYVETMLGRRRYLPDLKASNRMVREMAERAAINTPIQGSAADLIKKAMIGVDRRLREEKLASVLLLQVHDELVLEVPHEERGAAEKLVREEMESAFTLSVPLKVDAAFGANWAECKS